MSSPLRAAIILATLVVSTSLLAGCSLLGGGPARDDSGQVLESADIKSTELLVGDCFAYLGDDLGMVTINPCSAEHTHIIIGQGTLTSTVIDEAGGLQNAVSAACNESFTTFKTTIAEGVKTAQEFLVSTRTVDEVEVQSYSCVALDLSSTTADQSEDVPVVDEATEEG